MKPIIERDKTDAVLWCDILQLGVIVTGRIMRGNTVYNWYKAEINETSYTMHNYINPNTHDVEPSMCATMVMYLRSVDRHRTDRIEYIVPVKQLDDGKWDIDKEKYIRLTNYR